MRQKMILFNVLLMMFSHTWAMNQVGYLSVKTDSSHLVYINNQLVHKGSFDSLSVVPGNYTIHAYDQKSLNWQNRGFSSTVSVLPNQMQYIDFTSFAPIHINSDPIACRVLINDQFLGQTPLKLTFPVETGTEITLVKAGYEPSLFSINADQRTYSVNMTPISKRIQGEVLKASIKEDHFRWSREGLVLTTLASSWLAFFFKREADKNYDRYLSASDPDRLSTYYDRTRSFDRFSEIAVGVSIVSLGTYFYLLLTDD